MTGEPQDRQRIKVFTPVRAYTGISAGIQFVDGEAEVDPVEQAAALAYFREAGYGIGEPPRPGGGSAVPGSRAPGSAGHAIAGWAPKAGGSPEARERFAQAVDGWLAATGEHSGKAAALAKGRQSIEQGWNPMYGDFTSHGKARAASGAGDFEREAALAALDVDHEPGCPRPQVRELGQRVDGRQAGLLECPHCGASIPLIDRRVETVSGALHLPAPVPGPVGRPIWDPELFHRRYREAVDATEEPQTTARIADNFRALDGHRGIEPNSLSRLLRQHRDRNQSSNKR